MWVLVLGSVPAPFGPFLGLVSLSSVGETLPAWLPRSEISELEATNRLLSIRCCLLTLRIHSRFISAATTHPPWKYSRPSLCVTSDAFGDELPLPDPDPDMPTATAEAETATWSDAVDLCALPLLLLFWVPLGIAWGRSSSSPSPFLSRL
jgi:hypothetical protein